MHLRLRVRNQLEIKRQQGEIREMNCVLEMRNAELEELLTRVRHLESIVSICRYCTKIRVEHDGWQRIEQYVSDHADVIFSYGTCPDCRAQKAAP